MNGSIFHNFLEIEPNFGTKFGRGVYEWVTFFSFVLKNWYVYGFHISRRHIPTKTKLEYPPNDIACYFISFHYKPSSSCAHRKLQYRKLQNESV